jgi:hypothetical protein
MHRVLLSEFRREAREMEKCDNKTVSCGPYSYECDCTLRTGRGRKITVDNVNKRRMGLKTLSFFFGTKIVYTVLKPEFQKTDRK